MLVPGQPPCDSVKPKLFFHAVDDVVVGAKFVGTRGGSTARNPELARLRQPRSAVAPAGTVLGGIRSVRSFGGLAR